MLKRLAQCVNIEDLRQLARKRLPRALFEYIDGVAEDGTTYAGNRSAFDHYQLVPRTLVDVSEIECSTTVFGQSMSMPYLLCPTAFTRAFHHEGEMAVARASANAGLTYTLSTVANTSIEDIAKVDGQHWFQVYMYKDPAMAKDFIQRCKAANFSAMCLTVDASISGNREHDRRNGLTIPPKPSLSTIIDAIKHPYWCWHMLMSPEITTANIRGDSALESSDSATLLQYMHDQLDVSVDWDNISWMLKEWDRPFMIKGILSVDDAIRAADLGVQGIVVSNHGGRQLDQAAATMDVLPAIVDAVGDRCEIIVDSGIRRGSDIVKALALGANACMIGRPYLYGLAAGGEQGVQIALKMISDEFKRTMALIGCSSVSELNREFLNP